MKTHLFTTPTLAIAIALTSCREHPQVSYSRVSLKPVAELNDPKIEEQSGVIPGARPGLFWVQNDSGDSARIFPLEISGSVARRWSGSPAEGLFVPGARNVDWEDLAMGPDSTIWISDTGNNWNQRRDLALYHISAPDPTGATPIRLLKKINVFYPDQTDFPPKKNNFDSEALIQTDGQLYLLTKHRADTNTRLYKVGAGKTDEPVALEFLDEYPIGDRVTAADISKDGKRLAVLTYSAVWVFERTADSASWLRGKASRLGIFAGQCEGLCFTDDQTLMISNEEGQFFLVDTGNLIPVTP